MSQREEDVIALPNNSDVSLHTIISLSRQDNANPTLLLLHFWGGSNRTFSLVSERLRDNFDIVIPSLRGWGQSSRPEDPSLYHIEDYADDITNLLAYLRAQRPQLLRNGVMLAGHSMGGKIALLLTTKPELKDLVKGLVLVAPAPLRSFQLPTLEMRTQQLHAYDNLESARYVVENVLLGRMHAVGKDEISALAEDAFSGCQAAKKAWPEYGMAEEHQDVVLKTIRTTCDASALRVLVVVGSHDLVETPLRVQSETIKPLQSAGADVTFKELPNVGHLIPVEAPEELAQIIENHVTPKG